MGTAGYCPPASPSFETLPFTSQLLYTPTSVPASANRAFLHVPLYITFPSFCHHLILGFSSPLMFLMKWQWYLLLNASKSFHLW